MSHSTVLVVLKDADVEANGIEDALATALEKFDENKRTPRYVKLTRDQAIAKQRDEIIARRDGNYADYLKDPEAYAKECNPRHLKYISEVFPQELAKIDDDEFLYAKAIEWEEGNLDADGNITSTYNPHSKWDWYSIGGRWSGAVINATETIHHPEKVYSENYTQPAWDELAGGTDVVRKRDLEVFHGTFAFLGTDGEWHERGRMGWWGLVSNEQEPDTWDAQLKELVEAVPAEDWLVVVDVHI